MTSELGSVEGERLRGALRERLFGAAPAVKPSIGRFEISEPLGRGGMGVVFRAHDPALDREVALKLLRARGKGSEHEHARARMLREAKVLARLQHPNVVTIHEAGVHEGEVFVAMELLGGGDLRQWANEHQVYDRKRFRAGLERLLEAGRGLAAAHAAGIVHRDFKPSNVMLGADGRARVGDFGLARAGPARDESSGIGESSTHASGVSDTLTATGARVGTRAYMAPEQARGETVGEAADQYAFCVTAVEVLTGRRPKTAKDVPIRITGTPRAVWGVFRRGMAANPADRWPSVDFMLAALERIQRRRWPQWTLAGVGVIALVVATRPAAPPEPTCDAGARRVAEVWSSGRKSDVRDAIAASGIAAGPTLWASSEARVDDWLAGWAAAFDETCRAHRIRGELSSTVHDGRVRCLDTQLRRADALIEVVEDIPATALARIDDAVLGLPDVSRCSNPIDPRHDASIPADPERAANYRTLLGEVARRRTLRDLQQYEKAADGAIELAARAAAHPNTPLLAEATLGEGLALAYSTKLNDASARLETAARMAASLGDHELESHAWLVYADVVGRTPDKYDVAKLAYDNALAALERLPDDRRARARFLEARGSWLYQKRGEFEAGAAMLEDAVALHEELRGGESPALVATLHQLANAQSRGGKPAEADATLRRALDIATAFGADHPVQIDLHDVLAANLAREGKFDQALVHAREASRVAAATLPADSPVPAILASNLAVALLEAGQPEAASSAIDGAIERIRNAFGPEHYQVGGAGHRVRAAILMKLGRLPEALDAATLDVELCQAGLTRDHFWVSVALQQRADIHRARDDWASALLDHQESLRIEQTQAEAPHVRLVAPWRNVATDLRELGRFDEASRALDEARANGGSPVARARTALESARLARALGQDPAPAIAEAETLAQEAGNKNLNAEIDAVRAG